LTVRSLETSGDLRIPGGIVIVGAGAVGIAMAVSLARRGQRVTLLEGGPHDPPFDFERRNEGPGTGRFHQGLRSGRMKAFGGTTRLWGGQLVPFDRGDFTARDAEGQPLWPISYEAFAPWVTRAYELLGVPAEARDTAAIWARATGLEMTLGDRLRATMNVWLRQPDFTKLFARELEGGALIDVITDARLATIEFAQDGRVEQVEVVAPSGKRARLRPDRLVLAHGTVEIAGTLLRAQQAAPHCPFAANPHVGAWVIDHLHGVAGSIEGDDPARLALIFD
jgi:choline dehydrogenase-like flavoprotein